jgi:GT2 family glycosyltransferase
VELSIVTVTYECRELALGSLSALARDGILDAAEVVVVDSGSHDGTAAAVCSRFPQVRVLPQVDNVGFGRGCNLGTSVTGAERILFLNPDAVVSLDSIRQLLDHLDAYPGVAAVGPEIVDPDGALAPSGQRFPSLTIELARQWMPLVAPLGLLDPTPPPPSSAGKVDWISGACMLVRRSAWEDIGPFDERFFLYYEETDWCRRARSRGWEVHYVPSARAVHLGGGSAVASGESDASRQVPRHFVTSRRRYFHKHHGRLAASAVEGIHWLRRQARRARPGRLGEGASCR